MIKRIKALKPHQILFIVSVILQIALMVVNTVRGNIHVDEAMTILNARSLADNGTDILGEKLPVYFDTWLYGGQSPFATYLMAVFIKVFGYSLFVSRIPILIADIIGIWVFYLFIKELIPGNQKMVDVIYAFACFSPVLIFNSSYTLDCNFLPLMVLVGMYFLARAINTDKSRYYIFSMIFFGLGFYCYILSSIIIPTLLVGIYLMLIIKKKISLKNIAVSVITIFIIAIPFILSGLVQLGVIDDLSFLGFSISKMPYYGRKISTSVSKVIENIASGFTTLIFPDYFIDGNSSFLYTNFIGGFLLVIGLIVTLSRSKAKKEQFVNSVIFIIPTFITATIVCALCYFPTALYRFNVFNYIFIMLVGIGAYSLFSKITKINITKMLCIFFTASICITAFNWSYNYSNEKTANNLMYINSYDDALDYVDKLNCDSVGIGLSNKESCLYPGQMNERVSISLRYHYYGDDSFLSLKNELLSYGALAKNYNVKGNKPVSRDGRFYFKSIHKNQIIDDSCIILSQEQLDLIKYDGNIYNKEDFGAYVVLYKK